MVLVEGPPDADDLIPLLAHAEMKPPVALLVYADRPAERGGLLPVRRLLARVAGDPLRPGARDPGPVHGPARRPISSSARSEPEDERADASPARAARAAEPAPVDPLRWLAEAAGFADGERWWEHMVEHRRDGADLFAAILEAMAALREEFPEPATTSARPAARPTCGRRSARPRPRGSPRIAVVCGAWHAPALAGPGRPATRTTRAAQGAAEGEGLGHLGPLDPRPARLDSGYGAGVESPGWYHHLWTAPDRWSSSGG